MYFPYKFVLIYIYIYTYFRHEVNGYHISIYNYLQIVINCTKKLSHQIIIDYCIFMTNEIMI